MSVVSKYSLTKIANIEGVSVNAIKSSIMIGKKKFVDFINSKKRAKKDFNFFINDEDHWDLSENHNSQQVV